LLLLDNSIFVTSIVHSSDPEYSEKTETTKRTKKHNTIFLSEVLFLIVGNVRFGTKLQGYTQKYPDKLVTQK
jgi:hypothetical protein